jgi:hypothetical protein
MLTELSEFRRDYVALQKQRVTGRIPGHLTD